MSVLYRTNNSCFIDHREYILNLYKYVEISNKTESFALRYKLFSVKCDKKASNRKRKQSTDEIQKEISLINQMYEELLQNIPEEIKSNLCKNYTSLDTGEEIRALAKNLFETTTFTHSGINGGNSSDRPLKCKIKEDSFLIPHKSRFFCGCVKEQCLKLKGYKYDISIADPPWWNKFIRRLKRANDKLSYDMMYNEDIASIPVQDLFAKNCLVAIWCTNSPSNISAVKNLIFPAWGVEYLTTWYWMKVTVKMEPLCAFGTGSKKQPYERLILGKIGQLKKNINVNMIMSIPSALHSHKPPLLDLLSPYVNAESPQVLELFARYLLPNTTSVGYEPLKWQHISLYESVS